MNKKEQEEQRRLRKKFEELTEYQKKRQLWISRVPKKTKTEFLELAKEEFEEDWGMTLKWLLDFRKGLLSSPNEILNEKIDLLAKETSDLRKKIAEMKNKKEEMLETASGRKIRTGGGKDGSKTKS